MTEIPDLPVLSMTGFGAATLEVDGVSVRVEVRSVNNRHLKVSTRVPAALEPRVTALEEVVRGRVQRGTVNLGIWLRREARDAPSQVVASVAADYVRQFEALGVAITAEALVRLPGVLSDTPPEAASDEEFRHVVAAVEEALAELVAMRTREGAALTAELDGYLDEIESHVAAVDARAPQALEEHRRRMQERLDALLVDRAGAPEELVAREIAVLADKSDVAEELVRLRTHVAATREALAAGGPLGRRLDFLAQEMGREINTVGSKSSDPEIATRVVELKLGLERLREQAANLE